jgi:Spy/CpxP family protein refolding chaperone
VAVAPVMAKNVISPQADKIADHRADVGASGTGALKHADEELVNRTSAATNAFRMQQFNDSVAWGEALIASVQSSGYDTAPAEAVLAQLKCQEDALREALASGNKGHISSVEAKNNALTKQLRMSLNSCVRTFCMGNETGNQTCMENATCTENQTMEMNRLRENCTAIDGHYLEQRYTERVHYGGEIIDIFNESGYDTTGAEAQLGIIEENNRTFMNATGKGDRPAINAVQNENKKAWNTGKRSLWQQIRDFVLG